MLLDPQGGDGTGARVVSDPAEAFRLLLEKEKNDAARLAEKLHAKTLKLESDNRKYRQRISELRGSLPGEGEAVLKGDDLKKWQRYRELGDPSEVKASLERLHAALDHLGSVEAIQAAL